MTFVLVEFDQETQTVDFAADSNGYISLDGGWQTCVLYSLLSDQRVDEALPEDPRGFWGDAYPEQFGDLYGSRLWYDGRKLGAAGVRQGYLAATQALQWMVEDGAAESVSVQVEVGLPDTFKLRAQIVRPDGKAFESAWEVHVNGV